MRPTAAAGGSSRASREFSVETMRELSGLFVLVPANIPRVLG